MSAPPKKKQRAPNGQALAKWKATRVHLMYPSHLDFETYKRDVIEGGPWPAKHWSFCHENGHKKEEDPDDDFPVAAFEHTHVALTWLGQRTFTERTLDFADRHCNIKIVASDTHWARIMRYHTKDPVFLRQSEAPPSVADVKEAARLEMIAKIEACPTRKAVMRMVPGVGAHNYKWAMAIYASRLIEIEDLPPILPQQQLVVDYVLKPYKSHSLLWMCSDGSSMGKSDTSLYMRKAGLTVYAQTSWKHGLNAYDGQQVIHVDYPRVMKEPIDYAMLERLSDGRFHGGEMYEGDEKRIKCHIVVTSNQRPFLAALPKRVYLLDLDVRPWRIQPPSDRDLEVATPFEARSIKVGGVV